MPNQNSVLRYDHLKTCEIRMNFYFYGPKQYSMRTIFQVISVSLLLSCGSSNQETRVASATSQQKQIDSLTNVINQKTEVEEKKKIAAARSLALIEERSKLFSLVTTDKPAYDPVSLGGFKNISFHLFNDYNYPLEQVILNVHYIKANGKYIKTEQIIVTNIAAKSRQQLTAPDYTLAGTYLKISIESVLCKAINLCYYESHNLSMNDRDPFKCK